MTQATEGVVCPNCRKPVKEFVLPSNTKAASAAATSSLPAWTAPPAAHNSLPSLVNSVIGATIDDASWGFGSSSAFSLSGTATAASSAGPSTLWGGIGIGTNNCTSGAGTGTGAGPDSAFTGWDLRDVNPSSRSSASMWGGESLFSGRPRTTSRWDTSSSASSLIGGSTLWGTPTDGGSLGTSPWDSSGLSSWAGLGAASTAPAGANVAATGSVGGNLGAFGGPGVGLSGGTPLTGLTSTSPTPPAPTPTDLITVKVHRTRKLVDFVCLIACVHVRIQSVYTFSPPTYGCISALTRIS
jgi:hypothetical protein